MAERKPSPDGVIAAANRIAGEVLKTPILPFSWGGAGSTFVQDSFVQYTAERAGTYYIKVQDFDGFGQFSAGVYTLQVSLDGDGPLPSAAAPSCESKGVIQPGHEFCVDYVQSKRDGSGDTYLFLLLARDARGSCC